MNKRTSQSNITPAPAKRGRPKTSKNSSQSDVNRSLNEYKGRYKKLRKTLKHVVEEQVFFEQSLTNAETELLEIERDNAFILDQLSNFIKVSDDSSIETDSSEDEREEEKTSKKSTFTLPSMSSISSSSSLINPATTLLASTITTNSVSVAKRNSIPKSPAKGVSEAVKRHVEEKLNSKSNDDKLTLLEYIPDDIFSQDDEDDEATASSNNDEDLVIDEFNK